MKIEDYGMIGDLHTAALVGRNGSIDWLCVPRFDSDACMAALLGDEKNGHWQIAPKAQRWKSTQAYRPETLVLETTFETDEGTVKLIDCMPPDGEGPIVVRMIEGVRGRVDLIMQLVLRFNYGCIIPWVWMDEAGLNAVSGPDALVLSSNLETFGQDLTTRAEFTVAAGEQKTFVLRWYRSHLPPPEPIDAKRAIVATEAYWRSWCSHCTYDGEWRDTVLRSLITLKALTYRPTGGIIAAATTSLPEQSGGVRNWDYRYSWLRDATFTLMAFMDAGYTEEAEAWTHWLLRAVSGDPSELKTLYGAAGERRLREFEVEHLAGYEGSRPVRVGNAAAQQFQLDVFGEVIDVLHQARAVGLRLPAHAWRLERHLLRFVEQNWNKPDEGIWEIRGPRRHFTHSKVMAWVAMDRAVKAVEQFGFEGDLEKWRALREQMHDEICTKAYDPKRGVFVQYFGADGLDASVLMIPLVGFLPATDPRVVRTVEAIQRELMFGGLVYRYHPTESTGVDGLPPGEAAFLPCSFWLVDCLHLMERTAEARTLFEQLLARLSPLGLLSEEYDPKGKRLLGNFPQAFSHVGLINTAHNLSPQAVGPAKVRAVA